MTQKNSHARVMLALCVLGAMLLGVFPTGAPSAVADEVNKIPRLQGTLKELSDDYAAGAKERVASMVESRGLFVSNDKVRVMLEIAPGATLDEARLASYGIEVERKHDTFWRVLAPIGSLQRIAADLKAVGYIHTPQKFTQEYVGEGRGLTHDTAWISAGYGGSGVKVAVIDNYFGYLGNAISNGDIPSGYHQMNYTPRSFTEQPSGVINWHGTCCAEIVMDMAPDCDLYLIKIDDLSDLYDAKDYCITNGIKVVSFSLGYYNEGDYAGNGPICDAVNDAYSNGILWVKSAGNNASGGHYIGAFSDGNANNWHNFSGSDEQNSLGTLSSGNTVQLYLSWGWPTSSQDYDLYLYRVGTASPVATSTNPQTGTEPPIEEISYSVSTAGTYYVKILKVSATGSTNFQMFSTGYGSLQYNSAASSISMPGDATGCFTVGALHRCQWPGGTSPEAYSSRGPTLDGRIKPDITGPTMVNIGMLVHDTSCPSPTGGFGGTSAAAPHAAGAAACVLEAYPAYTVGQVWSFLTGRAIDKGAAGQDNDWGYGLLDMGALPTAEALTVTSPNGGENWIVASAHSITWTSSGLSAFVDIDYSIDGGATWTPIFSNTANDGSQSWTIPNTPSTNCLVRITDGDGSPTDQSNAPFTISAPPQNEACVIASYIHSTNPEHRWDKLYIDFDASDNAACRVTRAVVHMGTGNTLDFAASPNLIECQPQGGISGAGTSEVTIDFTSPLVPGAMFPWEWCVDAVPVDYWNSGQSITVTITCPGGGTREITAPFSDFAHPNAFTWTSRAYLGECGQGPTCEQPVLSLLGSREVSWIDPLWTVQVEVRNAGPGVAKNVNVTMNEDLAWLTIPDPTCAYGDIAAGGTSWGNDTYTFDLTMSPGGSFNVWFDVTYEDECGTQYQVRLDPEFNRDATQSGSPLAYRLGQNYPNPFNPSTTIGFQLTVAQHVNLAVFDVTGKLVRTLVSGERNAGLNAVNWDGKDSNGVSVASGIYFYKIQAGAFSETKKMVLLR